MLLHLNRRIREAAKVKVTFNTQNAKFQPCAVNTFTSPTELPFSDSTLLLKPKLPQLSTR